MGAINYNNTRINPCKLEFNSQYSRADTHQLNYTATTHHSAKPPYLPSYCTSNYPIPFIFASAKVTNSNFPFLKTAATYHMIHHPHHHAVIFLPTLFFRIWGFGEFPDVWQQSLVIPIPNPSFKCLTGLDRCAPIATYN